MRILLMGHVALDIKNKEVYEGGPPKYQLPIALAFNSNVTILTSAEKGKVSKEYTNLKIINLPSQVTTTFKFEQGDKTEDRILILIKKANDLTLEKIDVKNFDIIIVSGIAGEINQNFLTNIPPEFSGTIYIDAQSFTRKLKLGEPVKIVPMKKNLIKLLDKKNIVIKGSEIELSNKPIAKHATIIKTFSGEKIKLFSKGDVRTIQLDIIKEFVDSTGSGDLFLICFAILSFYDYSLDKIVEYSHKIVKEHLFIRGIPSIEESRQIIKKIIPNLQDQNTLPV